MSRGSKIIPWIRRLAPIVSRLAPPLASRWLLRLFITPQRRGPLQRERQWLEGSTRTDVFTETGIRIPVWSWGEGPAVLLVHGWSGRGSQMAVFAAPLVAAGFRVLAADMPGHGDAGGKVSGLPYFEPAIQAVAERFGPLHGAIAHSLGTAAVTLAIERGLHVERLVYLSPPEDLAGYLVKMSLYLDFPPEVPPRSLALLEKRFGVTLESVRGASLAPRRTTPLLILHDEGDRDVPLSEAKRIAELWPGAELRVRRGLGHTRIVRAETTIEAAREFLRGARSPAASS